ncbi:hypothetical protein UA08_04768 [Talaromyces atroroseus]|uniref:Ubiquitin-like domain-containing protein n=1 Tax=Talaromyces atroroseus TaxID=1441469 RepID=A0A225ANA2_TALAT|nr:hypothetical protein UA08_04768 [Talaromyces atroroseus]OKL59844.1 hypothetical protein UA08_04768 [Talaromyces atroroseus]
MDYSDSSLTPQPSPSPGTTPPQIYVIIRFSASIPDVQLGITCPSTTTAAGLKQLIRAHLPSDLSNRRIRLIYSGRGLEDAVPLIKSLKLPPSSRTSTPLSTNAELPAVGKISSKEKGKAVMRDAILSDIPRVYVHCSIGDIVLSASDLNAEAGMASTILLLQQQQEKQQDPASSMRTAVTVGEQRRQEQDEESITTPAPRGFDRLLSAGFTPGEVSALRSQFMALQSVSHTPDTMPSGAELRELEDRWMDEGSAADGAGTGLTLGGSGGGGGGDDGGGFGSSSHSALDDMLWGAVMGFFWPLGCAMWLRREEGVWSWRKSLAVFVGVVVNVAFGTVRVMN